MVARPSSTYTEREAREIGTHWISQLLSLRNIGSIVREDVDLQSSRLRGLGSAVELFVTVRHSDLYQTKSPRGRDPLDLSMCYS